MIGKNRRKEWVKTVAIIFLLIMLVLTFFSNTIMNYSLPEVYTESVIAGNITARIRGTGTVKAKSLYDVAIDESRVISSVLVKTGDLIQKGDVLFVLEDKESIELEEAIKQLEALKRDYESSVLTVSTSAQLVHDVESGKITSKESRLTQIDEYNGRIDALQNDIKKCDYRLSEIDVELAKLENRVVDTSREQQRVLEAQQEVDNANTLVTNTESKLQAANANLETAYSQIRIAENQRNNCQQVYDQAYATLSAMAARKAILEEKERQKYENDTGFSDNTSTIDETVSGGLTDEEKIELEILRGDESQAGSYLHAVKAEREAKNALEIAIKHLIDTEEFYYDNVSEAQCLVDEAANNYNDALDHKASCEYTLAEARRELADKQNSDIDAQLQDALITEKNDLNFRINKLEIEKAEVEVNLQELLMSFDLEIQWSHLLKQIDEQEKLVQELRIKAADVNVVAPVSGKVSQVYYVAGQTTVPREVVVQIQIIENGYTMSISVAADQAKKIKVGDSVDIQNSWNYNEISAVITGIRTDSSNIQTRLVDFDILGDVEDGQTVGVSISQNSADYELVVPNISIREDNNGKFVLIIKSKNTPLGSRYTAVRINVEVLASDDTRSAVSGALYGGEYVITNTSGPVEAGQLVRLPD